jgi:hypothetical protein
MCTAPAPESAKQVKKDPKSDQKLKAEEEK